MCLQYADAAVVKIHQAIKSRLCWIIPTRIASYALVYLYVVCQFLYHNQPLNEALYCYVFQIYGVSTAEAMELLEHFLAMNPDNE